MSTSQHVVQGDDGQQYVIEADDSLTPEQLQAQAAAVIHASRTSAAAPAASSAAGAPQGTPGVPFSMSIPARMVRGAVMDFGGPVDEAAVRLGRVAHVNGDAPVEAVQDTRRDMEARYAQERAQAGLQGADVARTVGAMVPQVLVTRALAEAAPANVRASLLKPQGYMDTAKAGAAQGAVAGATSNVDDQPSVSDAQYFADMGKQALEGAASGFAIAPASRLVAKGALALFNPGYRAVKNWLGGLGGNGTVAQNISNNPALLDNWMEQQARVQGVDWAKVDPQTKAGLTAGAKAAMAQTGQPPEEAVRNRLIAIKQGLPPLTTGQATRDPVLFSQETNNPAGDVVAHRNAQQTAAAAKATDLSLNAPGKSMTNADMGSAVRSDIQSQYKEFNDRVNQLYDKAKQSTAGYAAIANTSDMARNAVAELKADMSWMQLQKEHPDVAKSLQDWASGNSNLTVRRAVETLQSINKKWGGDKNDVPLGIVKKHLDGLVFGDDQIVGANMLEHPTVAAQFGPGVGASGDEAQELFNQARQARAALGRWQRASPMNAELSDKASKVGDEQIFNKFVIGGTTKDFANAWQTMSPETQDEIRRRFTQHILQMASQRSGDVTAAQGSAAATHALPGYASALNYLNTKVPPEKLKVMFPGDSLSNVRDLLDYVRLTQEAPPGSFVDKTNTAGAIADTLYKSRYLHMLPWLHNVGIIAHVGASGAKLAQRMGQSAESLNASRVMGRGQLTPGLSDDAEGLLKQLSPAVVVPGIDTLAQPPDDSQR